MPSNGIIYAITHKPFEQNQLINQDLNLNLLPQQEALKQKIVNKKHHKIINLELIFFKELAQISSSDTKWALKHLFYPISNPVSTAVYRCINRSVDMITIPYVTALTTLFSYSCYLPLDGLEICFGSSSIGSTATNFRNRRSNRCGTRAHGGQQRRG
eukprot:TRINITY_DN3920_c0_g2_i2.p1 TRINITY_DN3920_c0_g2~~TRINITY_DN3920_c0_g2_i2.p1  ORF type:complete len:157 (+),score=9.81 TRINITY_DN3920_c0_g2_i2:679-1149(+)